MTTSNTLECCTVESPTANSTSPPKHCMLESVSVSSCYSPFTTLSVAPPTSLLFPLLLSSLTATTHLSGCTAESCSSLLFPLPLTTLAATTPLSGCTVESCSSLLFLLPITM